MKKLSDEDILIALQASDAKETDAALRHLYAMQYPVIASFIKRNSGSEEDAADVFQDAITVFYHKIRSGELQLNCAIQTYLYAVAKNLWFYKLRKQQKMVTIEPSATEIVNIEESSLAILIKTEEKEVVTSMMKQIGVSCQKILKLYYFDRLRMKEIAARMALANEQVAKNKKSGCLKKLKKLIADQPHLKNIFK
ncbi:MAG: RNA polymerase sigma factor [Saprospiraceae bacterium]